MSDLYGFVHPDTNTNHFYTTRDAAMRNARRLLAISGRHDDTPILRCVLPHSMSRPLILSIMNGGAPREWAVKVDVICLFKADKDEWIRHLESMASDQLKRLVQTIRGGEKATNVENAAGCLMRWHIDLLKAKGMRPNQAKAQAKAVVAGFMEKIDQGLIIAG